MSEVQLAFLVLGGLVLWFLILHVLAWLRYLHSRPTRVGNYDIGGGEYGGV